ncbi:MAG: hypothetical protein AAF674_12700 [Pseudomonadota bacterium]
MSLANWFSDFCQNLRIKNESSISLRYGRLTKRLNTDFWGNTSETSNSWYVGSYGRKTAIHGTSGRPEKPLALSA